jgi:hypothetical protein
VPGNARFVEIYREMQRFRPRTNEVGLRPREDCRIISQRTNEIANILLPNAGITIPSAYSRN